MSALQNFKMDEAVLDLQLEYPEASSKETKTSIDRSFYSNTLGDHLFTLDPALKQFTVAADICTDIPTLNSKFLSTTDEEPRCGMADLSGDHCVPIGQGSIAQNSNDESLMFDELMFSTHNDSGYNDEAEMSASSANLSLYENFMAGTPKFEFFSVSNEAAPLQGPVLSYSPQAEFPTQSRDGLPTPLNSFHSCDAPANSSYADMDGPLFASPQADEEESTSMQSMPSSDPNDDSVEKKWTGCSLLTEPTPPTNEKREKNNARERNRIRKINGSMDELCAKLGLDGNELTKYQILEKVVDHIKSRQAFLKLNVDADGRSDRSPNAQGAVGATSVDQECGNDQPMPEPLKKKRRRNPFIEFCRHHRSLIKREHGVTTCQATKILANKWNAMTAAQKQLYSPKWEEEDIDEEDEQPQ